MDRSGRWRLPYPRAPSCPRWLGRGVATGLCGALVSLNGSPGGGAATALAVGGCIVLITAGSPTTTAMLLDHRRVEVRGVGPTAMFGGAQTETGLRFSEG